MARTSQVVGHGRGIDDRPHRCRPLLGTDPRPARLVVDRDGVWCLVGGRVALNHRCEMEPRGHFRQDRHAHLPASMRDHKLDQFRRDLVGCRDEISLILTVLIVNDDDDASFPECLDRIVDLREFLIHIRFLSTRKTRVDAHGAGKLVLEACRCPFIISNLGRAGALRRVPGGRCCLSIVVAGCDSAHWRWGMTIGDEPRNDANE